jgi:hypothetical protein
MRWWLTALLIAGCTKPAAKGDSLVVVTVDAVPPIMNVASLHTTATAGGDTVEHDVGMGSFSLGGGTTKDFGVQVPSSITGTFTIHVEARDAAGTPLGAGDGMTELAPGQRKNITVTLGPIMMDAGTDGGGSDGGTDLMLPPIVTEPVWIGSGGSAATSTQQLNINVGGSDTAGAAAAPSKASFTAGSFSSQTN